MPTAGYGGIATLAEHAANGSRHEADEPVRQHDRDDPRHDGDPDASSCHQNTTEEAESDPNGPEPTFGALRTSQRQPKALWGGIGGSQVLDWRRRGHARNLCAKSVCAKRRAASIVSAAPLPGALEASPAQAAHSRQKGARDALRVPDSGRAREERRFDPRLPTFTGRGDAPTPAPYPAPQSSRGRPATAVSSRAVARIHTLLVRGWLPGELFDCAAPARPCGRRAGVRSALLADGEHAVDEREGAPVSVRAR